MSGITTITPNLLVTIAEQQEKAASGKRAGRETMADARTATCRCGQLSATCTGEPVRVSVCHCYDCQKRSGSAFAFQARFAGDAVTVSGEHRVYEHIGDSGNAASFHFCPNCGSTLWYHARPFRELFAIAVGGFADKDFPAPHYSVWEDRKHDWVAIIGDGIEHPTD